MAALSPKEGVDRHLGRAAEAAVFDRLNRKLADRFVAADLGRVGDVAHRAGERAGAEEGALRPAQHLDARHVEKVDVGGEEGKRDHRFVEVDADLLLDAGLVAHDLAGGDAAHRHLALAGAEVLHHEAGDVGGDVLEGGGAAVAQVLLGRRGDREGHLGDRFRLRLCGR